MAVVERVVGQEAIVWLEPHGWAMRAPASRLGELFDCYTLLDQLSDARYRECGVLYVPRDGSAVRFEPGKEPEVVP